MKKKILMTAALIAIMSLSSVYSVYAGEWKQDERGWKYLEYDGTFPYTKMIGKGSAKLNEDGITSSLVWTESEPDYRVNLIIDSDNDGYGENYFFDLNGYLIINDTVKAGTGGIHKVNSDGAEVDDKGNVIKFEVPHGEIKADLGKGVLKDSFVNMLMLNLQEADAKLQPYITDHLYGAGKQSIYYEDGFNSTAVASLLGGKVYSIGGWSKCMMNDSNMSPYQIDEILGISHETETSEVLRGYSKVNYRWILQENPKVVLTLDGAENSHISLKIDGLMP